MRSSLLTLFGLLATSLAMAGGPGSSCDKAKLLDLVQADERETREAPPAAEGDHWQVLLHHSPLQMDGYKISARIEPGLKRAWVRRSGGIAGWVEWLGPYTVEPASLSGCPLATSLMAEPSVYSLRSGKSLPVTVPGVPAADR